MPRRYNDPCGIARAIDIVGERWALLVVRELLFGPKRFGQLRAGLHGISPNVLAQRLRELEESGVLERTVLDPPASIEVYALTDRGRALEPVLVALGRWGRDEPNRSDQQLTPDAQLLAFKTNFVPSRAFDASFGLHIDGEWFFVDVRDGQIAVGRGRPDRPTAVIEGDAATVRAFAFGRLAFDDADLQVTGDRRAARRFPKLFDVPTPG